MASDGNEMPMISQIWFPSPANPWFQAGQGTCSASAEERRLQDTILQTPLDMRTKAQETVVVDGVG